MSPEKKQGRIDAISKYLMDHPEATLDEAVRATESIYREGPDDYSDSMRTHTSGENPPKTDEAS